MVWYLKMGQYHGMVFDYDTVVWYPFVCRKMPTLVRVALASIDMIRYPVTYFISEWLIYASG
jgi:hypothetical protein